MLFNVRSLSFALPTVLALASLTGCAAENATSRGSDNQVVHLAPFGNISGTEPPSASRSVEYNPHAAERYSSREPRGAYRESWRSPRPPR